MASKRLNGYAVALLLAGIAAGTAPVAAEAGPPYRSRFSPTARPPTVAPSTRPRPDPAKISGDVPIADRQAIEATARARYLRGDLEGALDALNQLAEPRVRCLNVDGLVRTDRRVIIDYLGTRSGEVFTAEALARLTRRLEDLSFVSATRLRFDPAPDGTTTITPIAMERSMLPKGLGWGDVAAARRVPAGPARAGRQSLGTRRSVDALDPPAAEPAAGPAAVHGPGPGPAAWPRECRSARRTTVVRLPVARASEYRETRYRIGGGLSDWVTSWLRWDAGVAFDRIASVSRVAVEGRLNARALDDRLALIATAGYWLGAGDGRSFGTREFVATARSTAVEDVPVVTTLVGIADVSRHVAAGGVAGGESDAKSRRHAARASPAQRRHHHRRGLRAAHGLLDHRIPASAAHPLGHRRPRAVRRRGPGLAPRGRNHLASSTSTSALASA